MEFSRLFGSNFPNEPTTLHFYKDVGEADEATQALIAQFQKFMDNDNIASASALYEANKDVLAPYYCGMEAINAIKEDIYNAQIYALQQQMTVISETEPTLDLQQYSTWLKPVD